MIKMIGERLPVYLEQSGLEKSILAISFAFVLISFINSSMAAVPSGTLVGPGSYEEKNITFNMDQSVQNNGYFMTYLYARSGNLEAKNYAHGSGTLAHWTASPL